MPFLRFFAAGHEWGYDAPFIPSIGDTVTLWHAPPDVQEVNDCTDGVIVKRTFVFASDRKEDGSVWFDVELEEPLPDGHVPDSDAWPSKEHGKRKLELDAELKRILLRTSATDD